MWFEDSPPPPTLVPREGLARHRLRVFSPKRPEDACAPTRLEYLAAKCGREFHIDRVDTVWRREREASGSQRRKLLTERENHLHGIIERLRPDPGRFQGYDTPPRRPAKEVMGSGFDPRLIVLNISGRGLSLPGTLRLTGALRGALMAAVPQPPPEWLSGHAPDGSRSEKPHVAFLPLPFVGREYADGRVMGVALAIPRGLDPGAAEHVLGAWLRDEEHSLPRRHRLFDGRWFECEVEVETRESPPFSLRPETWTGPAASWGTVTPVVLDRHFDGEDRWERAAESVKDSCERIGLPRPASVLLHPVSMFGGTPRSSDFAPLSRKVDGGRMHHSHAVLVFGEVVEGPILVGAGRYRGYGLCRPLRPGESAR